MQATLQQIMKSMRKWPWNNAYQWSSWRPIISGPTITSTTMKSMIGFVFLLPGSFVVSSLLLCHHHQQQKELFIITECDNDDDDDFDKHSQADITTTTSTRKETATEITQIQRLNGISIPNKDDSDNIVFLDQVETMKKTKKKVPVGRISIWKDVTWQEEEEKIHRSRRRKRRMGSDYVQISYQGKYVKDANWIQFIRREKWDKYGNLLLVDNEIEEEDDDDDDDEDNDNNIQVDKYLWHRRGEWFLDAPRFARNPFYDTWGLHNRSDTELSIFDKPMGVLDPNLHSKLIIELDSYLILQNMVVWRIRWQVIETIENGREIHILCSCPADKIMDELIFFKEGEEENHHTTWKIGYSHPNKADEDHTVFMKKNGYILTSSP